MGLLLRRRTGACPRVWNPAGTGRPVSPTERKTGRAGAARGRRMDRVDLSYTAQDEDFRDSVRAWLEDALAGDFAALRGKGGSGREHEFFEERRTWNQHLAAAGWTCLGWPPEYGGRGLSLFQQVLFHEEYAKANAPARVNHLGEELLGPTLIAYGTEEQKARFLPGIRAVTELWCQGYSEPEAGSDLAGVRT